ILILETYTIGGEGMFRMNITAKITLLTVAAVLFSVISLIIVGYQVNFRQIDAAAGDELVGCASITSGLVRPDDLERLIRGDTSLLPQIETSIDWIVDHKPIFKNASIMSLDGTLLAVDKRLKDQ